MEVKLSNVLLYSALANNKNTKNIKKKTTKQQPLKNFLHNQNDCKNLNLIKFLKLLMERLKKIKIQQKKNRSWC